VGLWYVGSNMVVGRVWFLWYGLIFDNKAKLFYYGVVWTVGGNYVILVMTFEGQEVMELDLKIEICYWSKEIAWTFVW